MPRPRTTSADVPEFDSYPAPASSETPAGVGDEWPRSSIPSDNREMQRMGEKIGSTLGEAVGQIKSVPKRLEMVPRRIQAIRERIEDQAQELRQEVHETAIDWRNAGRRKMIEARQRAQRFAQEKPFHVIAAAGAVAFAVGAGLRIWRSLSD